ncbi:MAG TPA: hypothetical protein VGN12_01655 [Pirellulales bacterium]|jgi:flagellar M-ring protein FliF
MDLVNRIYGQFLELVRAMTPRARLVAALTAILVLASFAYLGRREFHGDTIYLLGDQELAPAEITGMQGALGKAKLNDFVVDGNHIRVPRAKQAAYLAALAEGNALPQTLTDVFAEASDKSNWFTSRPQQLDQARIAKKKGLALMLRSMHGVESADVDFDKEEPRGLRRDRIATAVVFLKLQAGEILKEDRAAFFQRTVAAALLMSPHDVTVADTMNHVVFGGHAANGPGDDLYRDLKRKYQADYEETVRRALGYVPGITVSADVELDRELRREENRVEIERRDAQGRLLIATQGSANQPANLHIQAPLSPTTLETPVRSENLVPSQNQTRTEMAGLTPKRVSISVGVPTSYFEMVYRQYHPNTVGAAGSEIPVGELAQVQADEISRIRQHVAGLIPPSDPSAGASSAVTVTPFLSIPATEAPEQPFALSALAWFSSSWKTLATLGIALVGLLTLRSTIRVASSTLAKGTSESPANEVEQRPQVPSPSARFRAEMEQRLASGRSVRDEVADLVREDPAAAANILRTWIGSANSP